MVRVKKIEHSEPLFTGESRFEIVFLQRFSMAILKKGQTVAHDLVVYPQWLYMDVKYGPLLPTKLLGRE